MFQEAANLGALHAASPDAGLSTAGATALESHHLYSELGNFKYGFNSPVAYPATTDPFPHRLAGLAAMIAGGLPLRVATVTSPGHFDTHAGADRDAEQRPAAHLRLAARLPARPRGARGRRPGDDLRLVGVRPPRPGERLDRDRSRLGRDRLPDRHEGDRHRDRRVPRDHRRAEQPRQPLADRRLPRDLLGDPRAVALRRREPDPAGASRATSGRRSSSEGGRARRARGARDPPSRAGLREDLPDADPGDGEGVLLHALEPHREVRGPP